MPITLLACAVILLAGCATSGAPATLPSSSSLRSQADELQRQADAIDAQATTQAAATRTAMDAMARATTDTLNAQAQGTRQVMDAAATQQALDSLATQRAQDLGATATKQAAEATRTAMDTEATATSVSATSTMRAAIQAVEGTAQAAQAVVLEATAQTVQRETERDEATQALSTFAGWALLAGGILAASVVTGYLLPVVKARLQVIRRRQGEVEPMVVTLERIIMPSRLFSPLLNVEQESAPMLAPVEYQDRASARAQLVDVVGASRGGQRVKPRRALPSGDAPDGEQWREAAPTWPTRVPLRGILDGPPSVHRLALGVTVGDDGRAEVVRADMGKLVHVAVGGSSGWGKSVFLRALGFQLARSSEPVDLALVDLEGATFAPFAECDRLLYPMADNERDALAIFQDLLGEMDRRKALFAQYPGVDSLAAYNARASDPLAPVVALVDEATALLADKPVENAVRALVLRARKYGLWCVLGGQDWKASSLDTAIRNQLATRVQFRAMSASQSRVLLQRSGAESLDVAGRALAILPGRTMVKLQAPVVSYQTILETLAGEGPQQATPVVERDAGDDDRAKHIRALAEEGLSKRQIALEVFGYAGGAAYTAVNEALQGDTTTTRRVIQRPVPAYG